MLGAAGRMRRVLAQDFLDAARGEQAFDPQRQLGFLRPGQTRVRLLGQLSEALSQQRRQQIPQTLGSAFRLTFQPQLASSRPLLLADLPSLQFGTDL